MTEIKNTLRLFGLTKCYSGFDLTAYSVHLAVENDFRLQAVTKEIYMETASHFHCKWTRVERNIRTAVNRAWQVNPDLLRQMAGYPLKSAPTSSQFIEIISSYIIRSQQTPH